ncbi:hypothetical protein IWQ60_001136 [Tieghemiomyces parasiticus]|uniref:EF-hand domain-containing protein n=1 Tax=Tieghemiomyces parasiticus TaxID=78921 RepID=A0A9W8E2T1_9FUNG|nr:hypothetical protein IWQ60_001136 [Tieghemiomyces parasiticus]
MISTKVLAFAAVCATAFVGHASASHQATFQSDQSHFGQESINMYNYIKENSGDHVPADLTIENAPFHYFTHFDLNDDGFLDGNELRLPWYESFAKNHQYVDITMVDGKVDRVLVEDDLDNDGLISPDEYFASLERQHQLKDPVAMGFH